MFLPFSANNNNDEEEEDVMMMTIINNGDDDDDINSGSHCITGCISNNTILSIATAVKIHTVSFKL